MPGAGVLFEELRFRLRGQLYGPEDPGYREACAALDQRTCERTRLVARCSAAEDVVAALAFACQQGLGVAVRGGGHATGGSAAGGLRSRGEVMLIDLRGIWDIEVDAGRRLARVGGGAEPAAVERAARRQGLATGAWRQGRPCPDLLGAQLVSAEGTILQTTPNRNPNLLRTLHAGGATAGVLTSLELRLHPRAGKP